MTTENKKAVINVSTSVPIVTSQQVPVATGGITGNAITQTVEYRDAGIILTVTPRIGEQGTVALEVQARKSTRWAPTSRRPSTRRASPSARRRPRWCCSTTRPSSWAVSSRTGARSIRTGIPLLSRIPVLGYLFGSVRGQDREDGTAPADHPPRVGTARDAARITEQMRRVTPELEESIRQAPRKP